MKKYILMLVAVLGLSGCTSRPMKDPGVALVEDEGTYMNFNRLYMNQATKDVTYQLYELSNQYRDRNNTYISTLRNLNEGYLEEEGSLHIYRSGLDKELFEKTVKLLDETIGQGLQEYYENIKPGQEPAIFNQVLIGSDQDDVFLIVDPFDIKDKELKQIYKQLFTGKYKLNTALANDDYSYLEVEKNNYEQGNSPYSNIMYGLIFKDSQLEKTNIFFNFNRMAKVRPEDLEIFNKTLDYLKLENRKEILEDFEQISQGKNSKKTYEVDGYRIRLIKEMNNLIESYNEENIQAYLSIERL